jgi:hypothetical protein
MQLRSLKYGLGKKGGVSNGKDYVSGNRQKKVIRSQS